MKTELVMKTALCISAVLIAAGAWAQEAPTFSTNVNLVPLLASVHDLDQDHRIYPGMLDCNSP